MKAFTKISVLALSACLGCVANAQFTDMTSSYVATGCNASGTRILLSNNSAYFFWDEVVGITSIGGNSIGETPKMSDDGNRVSGTKLNSGTAKNEIALYDIPSATWQTYGTLGGASGTTYSSGWGISGDGQLICGSSYPTGSSFTRCVTGTWSGTMFDIGSSTTRTARGNSMNFDGTAIVGRQDSSGGTVQGAVWYSGVQTLITYAGGSTVAGEAQDISNDGLVVVGSGTSANGFLPWRWTSGGGAVSLPNPLTSTWRGGATATNADGSIVIGYMGATGQPPATRRGVIWTAATSSKDMSQWARDLGVNLTSTQGISTPFNMSPDGKTIVGYWNPSGVLNAGFALHWDYAQGNVQLAGYTVPFAPFQTATVDVYNGGTLLKSFPTVAIAPNGDFSLPNALGTGSYDVFIKLNNHTSLRKKLAGISFNRCAASGINLTLPNGNCNNDTAVDLADFDILAAAFGTSQGDAGYVVGADLDGSTVVDLGDFDILSMSFGLEDE